MELNAPGSFVAVTYGAAPAGGYFLEHLGREKTMVMGRGEEQLSPSWFLPGKCYVTINTFVIIFPANLYPVRSVDPSTIWVS